MNESQVRERAFAMPPTSKCDLTLALGTVAHDDMGTKRS